MDYKDKGRIVTIIDKWFTALYDGKSIGNNNVYTFSLRMKNAMVNEIIGIKLTKSNIEIMEEYGIEQEEP